MNRAVFLCVLSCVIFATSSAPTLADTIVKPNTFTAGTPANADEVNANFDTVYDQVNKVGAAINVDQPTGNIGIGKTPTTSKLDVNGVIVALGFIGPVDWSSLINVPQTLATLICADREIARFNTSTTLWQCQPNDADTLGGLPASEFAPGEHLHDASDVTGVIHTFRGGTNATSIGNAGSVPYSTGTAYAFGSPGTSGQVLKSGGTGAPVWGSVDLGETTGTLAEARIAPELTRDSEVMAIVTTNDGSGSGLDADLLDGQHGSYYRSWSTLTGVPGDISDGDNDTTYTAGTGINLTATTFSANVPFSLTGASTGAIIDARNSQDTNLGYGVYGEGARAGVSGFGADDGSETTNYGGHFQSESTLGVGVYGEGNAVGVYGKGLDGKAGFFEGEVTVTGDITVGSDGLAVVSNQVGVGMQTPQATLDVLGSLNYKPGNYYYSQTGITGAHVSPRCLCDINPATQDCPSHNMYTSNDEGTSCNDWWLSGGVSERSTIYTRNGTAPSLLHADVPGNIGIGTTDPSAKLTVAAERDTALRVEWTDGGTTNIAELGTADKNSVYGEVGSGGLFGVVGKSTASGNTGSIGGTLWAGYFNGDVGITNGYLKLPTTSGAPPAADCDATSERGRMKVDSYTGRLYICIDSGWIYK